MTALFVTATGTDVGKTYVTCLLIRALRERGHIVRALKPIVTGFEAIRAEDSDTGRLLSSLGLPIDAAALDAVSPWRFEAPLSPDMAAEREGRAIDWPSLCGYCKREVDRARQDGSVLLIEGIGGVMVPIERRRTVLDWIAALEIPSLLVAGSYLGTLSHTLTAARALASRGCRLAGVVVDESADQPVAPEETAASLRRFLAPAPILVVPRAAASPPGTPAPDTAAAAARLAALFDSP